MEKLYRLHLRNSAGGKGHEGGSLKELCDYCIRNHVLVIGWSYLYNHKEINNINEYLDAYMEIDKPGKSRRGAPITFSEIDADDLIWTRDMDGIYYLCRATGKATHSIDVENRNRLDIGAVIPVEIVKIGLNVPGAIISRFYSTGGIRPTVERIKEPSQMLEYSKKVFNDGVRREIYNFDKNLKYDLFDMLDAWDLEELVIDYLQVKYDYYLSKNSITQKDTTIKIECELFPRKGEGKSAVVQVKRRRNESQTNDYYDRFIDEGKEVFLFYGNEDYSGYRKEIHVISKKELVDFVNDNRYCMPNAIMKWVELSAL